ALPANRLGADRPSLLRADAGDVDRRRDRLFLRPTCAEAVAEALDPALSGETQCSCAFPASSGVLDITTRNVTRLLATGAKVAGVPAVHQVVNHQLGVAHTAADVAPVGVKWGQSTQKQVARHVAAAQIISGFVVAGGTGIEPAPCGFGESGIAF